MLFLAKRKVAWLMLASPGFLAQKKEFFSRTLINHTFEKTNVCDKVVFSRPSIIASWHKCRNIVLSKLIHIFTSIEFFTTSTY